MTRRSSVLFVAGLVAAALAVGSAARAATPRESEEAPSLPDPGMPSTPEPPPGRRDFPPPPVMPPPVAESAAPADPPGDTSKAEHVADADDAAEKLPIRGKVKECCGYPIARGQDFRLSFYWLAYESEYASAAYDTDIYTKDGYWIGRFPNAFVFELKLEGSGILRDGRVLNYDGECRYGIGTCFKALDQRDHPLGRGVQARPLEPFRSIAVDPRYIPIGSPVYVPELVGLQLPDGTRHDGCLRADDQGGAIKLHKLDFFVESYFNFKFLADELWWKLKATPHLDEPRCEYLRLGHARERDNEHTDWAQLHDKRVRKEIAARKRAHHQSVWASSKRRHGGGSLFAHHKKAGKGKTALALRTGGRFRSRSH